MKTIQIALVLFCAFVAQPASARLTKLDQPTLSLRAEEYSKKAAAKIQSVLKREDCKFLGGHATITSSVLQYSGKVAALNAFLEDLADCSEATVTVRFSESLPKNADWQLLHVRSGKVRFLLVVNLSSKNISLQKLLVPRVVATQRSEDRNPRLTS